MDYRETTVTVYGTTRTIRTERTGTARQMETAHTRAVRAALEELHAAGKDKALAAAKRTARAADAAARNHHSGPAVTAAQHAHRAVARVEKRTFATLAFPSLAAMTRPHPPVKFDLDPADPRFAGIYEVFDPEAEAAERAAAERAAAEQAAADEEAARQARDVLDWLLNPSQPMPRHLSTGRAV